MMRPVTAAAPRHGANLLVMQTRLDGRIGSGRSAAILAGRSASRPAQERDAAMLV